MSEHRSTQGAGSEAVSAVRSYWLIFACAACWGTIVPGGKLFHEFGMSLYEISLYGAIIGAASFVPFLFRVVAI